ncbi:MAG: InlB B-repeat-containing protein, partial [Promethearchaeota archaeon]
TVSLTAESIEGWIFSEWSGDVSGSSNPVSLVIEGDRTVNAFFVEGDISPSPTPTPKPTPTPDQIVDVTFAQSGLDSSANDTVLIVQSTSKSYSDFPFTLSVNKGSFLDYDFSDLVTSSSSGKQFVLSGVSGPSSPISATTDVTIQANFNTQFEVSFSSNPETADASTQPEGTQWFDSEQKVAIGTDTSSFRYVFFQWETSNPDNQIEDINSQNTDVTINGPGSIAANYRLVQLQVSFVQSGITNPSTSPSVTYSINGGVDVVSIVPFDIIVDYDSTIEYEYDLISGDIGTERYLFVDANPISPQTVTEEIVIVGNYVHQYRFFFDSNGLDNSATGTVLIVDGEEKSDSDLPIFGWFDSGTKYSYSISVSGGFDKRFILLSPIGTQTITASGNAIGNYKVQYFFEVISPVGNPTGEGWYDDGASVSSSVTSPITIDGPPKIVYTSSGYDGTGSAPDGNEATVEFVIDAPSSITWTWDGVMTLIPNAIVDQNIPLSSGSDDHLDCVTDDPTSPNSKYIYSNVTGSKTLANYYSLPDVGSISGSIERVSVITTCRSLQGNADVRLYQILPSETPRSAETRLSTSWEYYSYTRTQRLGGGSWSWADIDNLQIGVGLQLNSDDLAACTQLWVEIAFTL